MAEHIPPLELSFGVEFECVLKIPFQEAIDTIQEGFREWASVRGLDGIQLSIVDLLSEHGIAVNGAHPASGGERYFSPRYGTHWRVENDATIQARDSDDRKNDPGYKYLSMELISRVLPWKRESFVEIRKVLDLVKSKYVIVERNSSTSTHIHIGASLEDKDWPLETLKKIAQLTLAFEHQINSLHSDDRIGNRYCRLNSECRYLWQLDPFLRGKAIEACDDLPSFVQLMNPDVNRQWAYNYTNLDRAYIPRTTKRTIELRQHRGCVNPDAIIAWLSLALGMVKYCHETPNPDHLKLWVDHVDDDSFDVFDFMKAIGVSNLIPYYKDKVTQRPRKPYVPEDGSPAGRETIQDILDMVREEGEICRRFLAPPWGSIRGRRAGNVDDGPRTPSDNSDFGRVSDFSGGDAERSDSIKLNTRLEFNVEIPSRKKPESELVGSHGLTLEDDGFEEVDLNDPRPVLPTMGRFPID